MGIHIFISIAVLVFIIAMQIMAFIKNKKAMGVYESAFKESSYERVWDEATNLVTGIKSSYRNPIGNKILNSINDYLGNNVGSVCDFHIIRELVERNCDTAEEEINAQIPFPLYWGLIGTMSGILIGVILLAFGGALSPESDNFNSGITALLQGIGIAMIGSIIGIFLTIYGSSKAKDAKNELEANKNEFLNWILAIVMPKLSNSAADSIKKLASNLMHFNQQFSSNTKELKETLSIVNESMLNQANLMKAVNLLKIDSIATANIRVYEELKNCTDEIGLLGEYLHSTNKYLKTVESLNNKLDQNETRTKAIEDMGTFFKNEVEQFDLRKAAIEDAVGTVDRGIKQSVGQIQVGTNELLDKLSESTRVQLQKYVEDAQVMRIEFREKMEETSVVVDELKNLTAVKDSLAVMANEMKNLQSVSTAMGEIKRGLDQQSKSFLSFKQDIVYILNRNSGSNESVGQQESAKSEFKIPKKYIIAGAVSLGLLTLCSLMIISVIVYEMFIR
jgi:hypothetical protein